MPRQFSWKRKESNVSATVFRAYRFSTLPAILFIACCFAPLTCYGQPERSHESRLAEARIEFNIAKENVAKAKRLFERGSLSERRYREFQLELDLATLKLTMLKEPDRKDEIELLIAKAKADSAKKIREEQEKLFQTGSCSRLDLDRAIFVQETSELLVKYLQCDGEREKNFIAFQVSCQKSSACPIGV